MQGVLAGSLAPRRLSMLLFSAFAALALLLCCIGIYGVISHLVGQRTHEIGVRMALGAQPGDVMRLILGQGLQMAFLGVLIGRAAALALTRLMASQLFGVSWHDPLTFVVVGVVALLACYIPARLAIRVDPLVALKYE